jgi:hypothetical protein
VHRDVDRALQGRVGEHDHCVFAAQFQRARDQPGRRPARDGAAGARGAGEHDEVDRVDQRFAGAPRSSDHLEDIRGPAAFGGHLLHHQGGQRGVLGGFEQHGVARRQRRDRIAERVDQRVVPRADHADDTDRLAAGEHRAAGNERGERAHPVRAEVSLRRAGPVRERSDTIRQLDDRVLVALAALRDDARQDLRLVLQHPAAGLAQAAGAAAKAQLFPAGLGAPRSLGRFVHRRGGRVRHAADHLAGGRIVDLDGTDGAQRRGAE